LYRLLLRQYDVVGELIRALDKTYVFSSKTIPHIKKMWTGLSRIRALLPVQMSGEEEGLMRFLLWELVNNHIFFQHPDLIRILRVHENVMALMMNTLGRQQAQSEAQGATTPGEGEQPAKEKVSLL
jgi:ryanodine receptor 2